MDRKLQLRLIPALAALLLAAFGGGLAALYLHGGQPAVAPVLLGTTAKAASVEQAGLVSFADVVKQSTPAVVNISSTKVVKVDRNIRGMMDDPFFRQFFGNRMMPRDQRSQSLGSGVIVSKDGYILTNNHVVDGADSVKVFLNDRREFSAKIVGTDKQTDVAILKINASNLPTLALSDSSRVQVGDVVLAIGNPLGIGQSVTMGIVSATSRSLGGQIEQYEDFIQTDAAINHGNSGGALINTRGELIGINTAILSQGGGSEGIGFAIPVNLAKGVMDQIVKTGKVRRGYLGATVQNVDGALAKAFGLPDTNGAALPQVEPGTPAAKAGLKAGDVVTEINGQKVTGADALRNKIASLVPGTQVNLKIYRDGQPKDLSVTLGERPAERDPNGDNPQIEGGQKSALEGVSTDTLTAEIAQQLGIPGRVKGVVVSDVDEASQAAQSGLRRGDVITAVDRKPVTNSDEFDRAVRGKSTVLLTVNRGGATFFLGIESK